MSKRKILKYILYMILINIMLLLSLVAYLKKDLEDHFNIDILIEQESLDQRASYYHKIMHFGYEFEEHKVLTEDGYILRLWRIYKHTNKDKEAVIINHGLLDSAATFLAHDKNKSLPFMLASRNYDVWLVNNRGTIFSHEHVDKSKTVDDMSSDYWDFTFHELAKYDVIANINYVKKSTGKEKINWLCHSQGCFQFFLSYTMYPDFIDKSVNKIGTMGSVLKIKTYNKYFPRILKFFSFLEWLEYFGIRNMMRFNFESVKYFGYLCHKFLWICRTVIGQIVENEATNHIEYESLLNLFYHQPGGTSTKNLIHWMQIIGTDHVRQYDYGPEGNLVKYNSSEPLEYDLEKLRNIKLDIFLTSSEGDPYCLTEDLERMKDYFKNANVTTHHVGFYNHLDYLWGKNAHVDLYKAMIDFLEK